MDAIEAIEVSQVEFERRLCAVRDDQWSLPTPCEKWTVRELVSHLVRGARTYLALLDGCSREQATAIFYGSELSGNPVEDFRRAAGPIPDAFRRPQVAERVYPHPDMDVTGAELVWWRSGDNTIHTWDLARAIGADERLDERLVDLMWERIAPTTNFLVQSGHFGSGPSGQVESVQPKQLRLLDACGRRP